MKTQHKNLELQLLRYFYIKVIFFQNNSSLREKNSSRCRHFVIFVSEYVLLLQWLFQYVTLFSYFSLSPKVYKNKIIKINSEIHMITDTT